MGMELLWDIILSTTHSNLHIHIYNTFYIRLYVSISCTLHVCVQLFINCYTVPAASGSAKSLMASATGDSLIASSCVISLRHEASGSVDIQ